MRGLRQRLIADHSRVGHCHRRHIGVRQHLLDDLILQHSRFDAAELLFVGAQKTPHLHWLLVAARDFRNPGFDAVVVGRDRFTKRNGAHHDPVPNRLRCGFAHHWLEVRRELPQRCREAQLLLCDLGLELRLRELELVRGGQRGKHFPLGGAARGLIEFDLHPAPHRAAERRHAVAFRGDAEGVEKGVVEFWEMWLLHAAQRDLADRVARLERVVGVGRASVGRRRILAASGSLFGRFVDVGCFGDVALVVVMGGPALFVRLDRRRALPGHAQRHREGARFGRGHADDRTVHVAARFGDDVLRALAALQGLAVRLDRIIDQNPIVDLRRPLHGMPGGLLVAQLFNGVVDVRLRDLRLRHANAQGAERRELELGKDLEGGRVLEVLADIQRHDVHVHRPGRRQLLLRDGLLQARLQQRRRGVLEQLVAEALPHHPEGHLALAETGELDLAGGVPHLLVDQLLQRIRGQGDGDLALKPARRFNRYPHVRRRPRER